MRIFGMMRLIVETFPSLCKHCNLFHLWKGFVANLALLVRNTKVFISYWNYLFYTIIRVMLKLVSG